MNRDAPRLLLTTSQLERSGTVANCRMNRERTLTGGNGYTRELGINPLDYVVEAAKSSESVRWLDLCCGTGIALIEAARFIEDRKLTPRVEIVGVDLVGLFAPIANPQLSLQLIEASLSTWTPDRSFDLITCVHGLHYIGDKLGLLTRAVSWLTQDGLFVANLSLENVKLADSGSTRIVAAELRREGMTYDYRQKRVTRNGRTELKLPFRYLGADDGPGPNYTGQAAVDSHYDR